MSDEKKLSVQSFELKEVSIAFSIKNLEKQKSYESDK